MIKLLARLGVLMTCRKVMQSYLDPGSGSLIVQVLIALIVGILATFRIWKAKLLALFGIKRRQDEEDNSEDAT